jgi:hypothetical protein
MQPLSRCQEMLLEGSLQSLFFCRNPPLTPLGGAVARSGWILGVISEQKREKHLHTG